MENFTQRVNGALNACPAYPVFDTATLSIAGIADWVQAIARGGARMAQLRLKEANRGEFSVAARKFTECARSFGVLSIINNRMEIALETGADGVHLGAADFGVADARRAADGSKRPDFIIGASARTVERAAECEAAGASYLGCGAFFITGTKDDAVYIGADGFAAVASAVRIPVVAIGGIGWDNFAETLAAGAAGFAAISMFAILPSELESRLKKIAAESSGRGLLAKTNVRVTCSARSNRAAGGARSGCTFRLPAAANRNYRSYSCCTEAGGTRGTRRGYRDFRRQRTRMASLFAIPMGRARKSTVSDGTRGTASGIPIRTAWTTWRLSQTC